MTCMAAWAGCADDGESSADQPASARPRPEQATRPRIEQWRIPFPASRKREMARYARRHYGLDTHRLRRPRVIVGHVALSAGAGAVRAAFAADRRDPELHELPGLCAHFLIGSTGTIYQLVPLTIMCRHTVGLNHTAIGIEHTGFDDSDVLGNRRVLRASLRLTRWLRCRHGIRTRDVIGHAESLSSPYHHERVPRLRRQTHADLGHPAMTRYRRLLRRMRC